MTKLTSKSVSAVRFPLSVMVVMLHTYIIDKTMGGGKMDWVWTIPNFGYFRPFCPNRHRKCLSPIILHNFRFPVFSDEPLVICIL